MSLKGRSHPVLAELLPNSLKKCNLSSRDRRKGFRKPFPSGSIVAGGAMERVMVIQIKSSRMPTG